MKVYEINSWGVGFNLGRKKSITNLQTKKQKSK